MIEQGGKNGSKIFSEWKTSQEDGVCLRARVASSSCRNRPQGGGEREKSRQEEEKEVQVTSFLPTTE